ncbi:rhodanese-like domain-containing protein [Geomonas sp. RF6]|uniref:rhodanese-like domain-containing protein n=1 Tax=Geomonas sp. RF6 TaxID=2897342 RepID=UPI001E62428B|nr:rhodanese-like domain-containing protein [Geomonas sp. RF6]UFS72070.1 rhodanese-like domain-containing protein [Geomonas sp. RF6]
MKRLIRLTVVVIVALIAFPMLAVAGSTAAAKSLVIDVRSEAEWKDGHLEGAVLIPYQRIADDIVRVAPDKGTKIGLYCRSGRRSDIALQTLKTLGYRDVVNYGGLNDAARKLNIPIVK